MIITIDVDLTICDPIWSEGGWCDYLKNNSHSWDSCQLKKDKLLGKVDYNLTKYFNLKENVNPYDFWREKHLYENIIPYQDAIKYINLLCDKHKIVFLSHCKGNHMYSKVNMINKYFPNKDAFMATKEKNSFPSDIHIDDRNEYVNNHGYGKGILFETEYTQHEKLDESKCVLTSKSWEEIYNFIEEEI